MKVVVLSGPGRSVGSGLGIIALFIGFCALPHIPHLASAQVSPLNRPGTVVDDYSTMESAFAIKDYNATIASGESFLQTNMDDPRAGRAVLLVGESYFFLNNFVDALRFLEVSAADESPETALESYRFAAEAAYQLGDPTKAVDYADRFLADAPQDPFAAKMYCLRGNVALNEGRYEDAITDFNYVKDGFPASEFRDEALFGLAETYRFQNDPAKAAELYQEIMTRLEGPMALEARYSYGAMLGEIGERDEAARVLSKLLDEGPDAPRRDDACLLMGMLFFEQGLLVDAEGMFEQAATSPDPEKAAKAGYWRGIVRKESEPAEAERIFRETLDAYPGSHLELDLKQHLASSLLRQFKNDEAKLILDELDEVLPVDSPARESLLYSYTWQANQSNDIEALDRYVAEFNTNWPNSSWGPYVSRLYAGSLIKQGRFLDAYETLHRLTSSVENISDLQPWDLEYYFQDVFQQVTCLFHIGDQRDLARSRLQMLEENTSAPTSVRAQSLVAWAGSLNEEGRYEEVLPILEGRMIESTDPRTGAVTLHSSFTGSLAPSDRSFMGGTGASSVSNEESAYVWESIDATEAVTIYVLAAFNSGRAVQAKAVYDAYQQQALDPTFPTHYFDAIRDTAYRAGETEWAINLQNAGSSTGAATSGLSDPYSGREGGIMGLMGPPPGETSDPIASEGATPGTTLLGPNLQNPLPPLPLVDPNLGQEDPPNPSNVYPTLSLSNAREASRRMDWEGVVQATEQICDNIDPTIAAEACFLRAEALNKQGNGQPALYYYERVITLYSNSEQWADSLFRVAEYYESIGQRTQALDYYERLIEGQVAFRDMDLALYSFAWILWDEQRYAETQAALEQINRNHPMSDYWSHATVVLVEYALLMGEYGQADLRFSDLERRGFDSSLTDRVLQLAPSISILRQEWDKSEAQWNALLADAEAAQDGNGMLTARYGLAELAYHRHDYPTAGARFRDIMDDLDPADTNPLVRRTRAKIFIRMANIGMEEEQPLDVICQLAEAAKETAPSFERIYEADLILGISLNKRLLYSEAEIALENVLRNPWAQGTQAAARAQFEIGLSLNDRRLYQQAAIAFRETYDEPGAWSDLKAISLLGAALCYEEALQNNDAILLYERVEAEFPRTAYGSKAREALARLNANN